MAFAAITVLLLRASASPAQTLTLGFVLDRLDAYLSDYADRLPATVSSEHYVQTAQEGLRNRQTTLDSDFAVARFAGVKAWIGFRQVLKVDGEPVAGEGTSSLFLSPETNTPALALRMTQESARYNLGPMQRTINNPALVLELLDGRNRARMRFTKERETDLNGVSVWVVRFEERARPTIIHGTANNRDIPAKGRAWIDPSNGTLMKAEVLVEGSRFSGSTFTGEMTVTFKLEPKLGFWVPANFIEGYQTGAGTLMSSGDASYENYRQFSVSSRILP